MLPLIDGMINLFFRKTDEKQVLSIRMNIKQGNICNLVVFVQETFKEIRSTNSY